MRSTSTPAPLHVLLALSLIVPSAGLAACGSEPRTEVAATDTSGGKASTAPPRVATSFYPSACFVRRMAGELVELVEPVPADADPAFWEPTREDLATLQAADLIVLNGAGFERWVEHASLPESRVLRTSDAFQSQWLKHVGGSHSHGDLAPHSHEGTDGHTWMDPNQVLLQVQSIREALVELLPDKADEIERGWNDLRAEIADLDARWRALAPKLADVHLIASHPSYDYLARRYGFTVVNLDLDPEAALSSHDREHVDEAAQKAGGRPTLLLWESEPLAAIRATLDASGVTSVVCAPGEALDAAARAAGEDFFSVHRANLERLERALAR